MNLEFRSYKDRDAYIIENAEYFTVGCRLGPKLGYDRHEVKTLTEAENLAGRMANKANKAYLIYAIVGMSDAFVKAIHPEQTHA